MNEQLSLQQVIDIHYIARLVEQAYGAGRLSKDLRDCGDRLNILLQGHVVEGEEAGSNADFV